MDKIKVLSVFGTRPEAIKMAPLVKVLEEDSRFVSAVAVTAQHRDMLDQVLTKFNIKPDYDLDIMEKGQSISDITTKVLNSMGSVYKEVRPDIVLVHGDTTTTFAAALAAFYEKIPIGHVEAGLRSFNKYEPYPEEINRVLTSKLADLHFSPTDVSADNLLSESISDNVFVTGNTVIDALLDTVKIGYSFKDKSLNSIDFTKRVIFMTAHRRENLGKPLEEIFESVLDIANRYDDVFFVYAVHKNPLVNEPAHRILGGHPRILLTEPIEIDDCHNLISKSFLVLTDSGGLQEEAPSLNKPVVVLRNVTERPEGEAAGTLVLAGTKKEKIIKTVENLLNNKELYEKMSTAKNPYGDGNSSRRIADCILYYFGKLEKPSEEYI